MTGAIAIAVAIVAVAIVAASLIGPALRRARRRTQAVRQGEPR